MYNSNTGAVQAQKSSDGSVKMKKKKEKSTKNYK